MTLGSSAEKLSLRYWMMSLLKQRKRMLVSLGKRLAHSRAIMVLPVPLAPWMAAVRCSTR